MELSLCGYLTPSERLHYRDMSAEAARPPGNPGLRAKSTSFLLDLAQALAGYLAPGRSNRTPSRRFRRRIWLPGMFAVAPVIAARAVRALTRRSPRDALLFASAICLCARYRRASQRYRSPYSTACPFSSSSSSRADSPSSESFSHRASFQSWSIALSGPFLLVFSVSSAPIEATCGPTADTPSRRLTATCSARADPRLITLDVSVDVLELADLVRRLSTYRSLPCHSARSSYSAIITTVPSSYLPWYGGGAPVSDGYRSLGAGVRC